MNPLPPLNINDADLFLPNVEKMMRSYRVVVAAGEVKAIIVPRLAYVIAETSPAPSEIEYTFGEQNDANNQDVWDKSVAGYFYASGRGRWFFKHNSASAVVFLIKDAGGAAAGDAAALPSVPSSLDARLRPVVWGAEDLETVDAASELLVAANAARRALAVYNASAAGQVITLSITDPAVGLTGFLVLAAGEGYIFNPLDGVTTAAIYVISSAAGGQLAWSEGT